MAGIKEFLQRIPSRIRLQVQSPYRRYKRFARYIKVRIQMLIGLGLVVLILGNIIYVAFKGTTPPNFISSFLSTQLGKNLFNIIKLPILEIVAGALYISTAVDLAYMLFTPALDEAVDPLISGLAATILLTVSKVKELKDIKNDISVWIAVLGIVLAVLFLIRRFAKDEED